MREKNMDWVRVGMRRILTMTALALLVGSGRGFGECPEGACAGTGGTCNLTAGQTTLVGTVTICNDANNVYVTYALDTTTYPGAYFDEELQMWAGLSLLDLPATPGGIPIPGQFCQADGGACSGSVDHPTTAVGESSYTFTIPFDQLSIANVSDVCDQTLYVFTHSHVIYDKDGDSVADEDTAWGGCIGTNIEEPGRWYYHFEYTICCDFGDPNPPFCQTAYAKGGYVWTTDKKSNPESLPSLNLTKNRWGWAIELTSHVEDKEYDIWAGAGLNKTSNGTLVGTLKVTWNGSLATVTYTMKADYCLEEVHLWADDASPDTIAPGQYGNIAEFDPNETEYTFTVDLADTDNDGAVWLVAHAVVCNDCD